MPVDAQKVVDKPGRWQRWWSLWAAGGIDHDAVLREISGESGWSGRYAFLIIVSAAISLLGLLMPSVAVLIGAMLLSPLMMPIIGIGFGIATFDFEAIRRASIALAAGSAIAILLAIVFVSISPIQTITSEIAGRTRPTLFDLLVALLSAVAGAYALIRGRGATVVGVAIAIALMPPLVVVGFGIAVGNWTVFTGSLLLFLTNAVTIALTVALVARLYGFGSHLSPHHTGWQLLLFIGALGLLSIPLITALKQIAFEAVAQRQVRDTVRKEFLPDARLSQLDIDYSVTPMRVRAVVVTPRIVQEADAHLATDLQRTLSRPVDIHVDQLRVSNNVAASEAMQIAQAGEASKPAPDVQRARAVADLALIAGADPTTVKVDISTRSLTAAAAPLPGLELAGYQALEDRARKALPAWTVAIIPPAAVGLPKIGLREGVIEDDALRLAAWASARVTRIEVIGGTAAQRAAVADGIVARGGSARAVDARGPLMLKWLADTPMKQP